MNLLALAELVAVTGGTVHTMVPGEEPRPATLLVEDGRVHSLLAPDAELPEGVDRIVDASGRHVVPGLVDGLVYFDPEHDALYLSSGVTLVRDIGGDPSRALLERTPAARARTPGPSLLTAGAVLDGKPPSSPQAIVVETPEQAREAVSRLVEAEVDFLSVQPSLGEEPWRAVLERAEEAGLAVWGHLPQGATLEEGLAAGHGGLFYLDALLPPGTEWAYVLPIAFRERVAAVAEAGVPLVPMLTGVDVRMQRIGPGGEREAEREERDASLIAHLSPHYEVWWHSELERRRQGVDAEALRVGERVRAKQYALLGSLHEAGVPLLPGSSSPQPWFPPGLALHDELAAWVEAGVPTAEALRLATRGAAELLGVEDRYGSLAPGLSADFLVVDGDPRESLAPLRRPEWVAVRGGLHDRADLDDRLATLRVEQLRARDRVSQPLEIEPPETPEGTVVLRGQVETGANGVRVGGERYAVVREPDGAIAYCTRMLTPGSRAYPDVEVELLQRVRDGKLADFEFHVGQGEDELVVRGLVVAGRMNVRREFNGRVLDTQSTLESIVTVSLGSVTSLMIAARRGPLESEDDPPYAVLHFHDRQEPEVLAWALALDEAGVFLLGTPQGPQGFVVGEGGAVTAWERREGGDLFTTLAVETDRLGGGGLPLPDDVAQLVRETREAAARAAEAAAAEEAAPPAAGGEEDAPGEGGG